MSDDSEYAVVTGTWVSGGYVTGLNTVRPVAGSPGFETTFGSDPSEAT